MADDQTPTGEITQRFRAFTERVDDEKRRTLPIVLTTAEAVLIVAVVAVILLA